MMAETRARSTWVIHWKGELAGGVAAALVSFTIALPLGTLALAPLGPRYAAVGVVAGLSCAMFGGLAEYSSMLLGFQYLLFVAVALYVISIIGHQKAVTGTPAKHMGQEASG